MEKTMNALRGKIEKKEPNWRISRIPQELKEYLRPGAKGKDRQINMAKPTNPIRALIITAKIRGIKTRILIDSGCLDNFMSSNFVKKAQFHIQAKEYQYTLYKIND
jgi:hypothetical protein